MQHDVAPWQPFTPVEVADRLEGLNVPWAIVGGVALDLFLGAPTRDHEDIEIAIPRDRFAEIAERLPLEFHVPVGKGRLAPLRRRPLSTFASHQTWGLDPALPAWRIDVFREPTRDGAWVCRRDRRIRLPYAELIERTADGLPYARPEAVLLFKAKAVREKDAFDLEAVLPRLSDSRRDLLARWLRTVHPGHEWLRRIAA